MTWLHEGNGFRCARHDEAFSLTSSCSQCATDLGPPPHQENDEPLPPPPPGCLSTVDAERRFVDLADYLRDLMDRYDPPPSRGRGNKRGEPPDPTIGNLIAKLAAEHAKALRQSMTLAREREHEIIVRRREARDRELRGTH